MPFPAQPPRFVSADSCAGIFRAFDNVPNNNNNPASRWALTRSQHDGCDVTARLRPGLDHVGAAEQDVTAVGFRRERRMRVSGQRGFGEGYRLAGQHALVDDARTCEIIRTCFRKIILNIFSKKLIPTFFWRNRIVGLVLPLVFPRIHTSFPCTFLLILTSFARDNTILLRMKILMIH